MQKQVVSSLEEANRLIDNGYAVTAIVLTDNGVSFFMEKGSKWSRLLGSR